MSSILEIQISQRERLYELLMLKKSNPDTNIKGLNRYISKTKSGMSKEEISYVEKLVEQEDDI